MRLKATNEWLAARVTVITGSMWCAYVFMVWALIPLWWPEAETVVAYVSQAVLQLVLLPVILVGSTVLSKAAEQRAEQDHKAIMLEVEEIQEVLDDVRQELTLVREIHSKVMGT